ncbi:hypothetical protein OEZ85_012163 [Tetradesmus obliquus]|uniref:Phosphodiesterase n=1 Tax=Tetradesmus obliquus TaxID=3088 RepID=A0ABY8TSV4_TETOB|nr:hypothetical protein OEZ85_012163 [Tetradesmus obliquus]
MDVQSLCKAIDLINKLAVELDIDAAMRSVRDCALELLECDRVTLFLIIESRRELRAKTAEGVTIVVRFGEGIAGTVAQRGGVMNIEDAYCDPLFSPEVDVRLGYRTNSILCCSIADMSGKNIAVLQALNKRSGSFTKLDEQHLQLFGVHLGNTLAKARLYEETKRERARLSTLNKCFKRLNAVTDLSGALDTIALAVKELVHARHVVVLLMDVSKRTLWSSISTSSTGFAARLFCVKEGEGIIGACAADGAQVALCLADKQCADSKLLELHELLAKRRSSKLADVLLQPVTDPSNGKCMAVLCALNKHERPASRDIFYEQTFTPSDCEALSVFSMEVADVLSQRALEVSFASAMSGSMSGAGAAQEQLTSMLKAQLLDYFSTTSEEVERSQSSTNIASRQFLHHCASISGPHIGSRQLDNEAPAEDRIMRRCSIFLTEEAATGLCSPLGSPLSPSRSFQHHLPSPLGRSASTLASLRPQLLSWELDCSTRSQEELVRMAYDVFMMSGVVQELELAESDLSLFLSAVAGHYHAHVPYHNFGHAVQVLHTVWMIMEHSSARCVLSAGEELVLLVAAICHDLDHDGFTNSYHVASHSELAQRYNDKSVQENHHCALTFQLLRTSGNLLARFAERAEWEAARRLLVEAILSTDMHGHFTLTQELQKHGPAFAPELEADRTLLVKAILHAADISNPLRPWQGALAAAERVHAEFAQQAAQERLQQLPVAPHMEASDPAVWARMEVEFIDYVVGPLWSRLSQFFPALQQPLQQMHDNRASSTFALGTPDGRVRTYDTVTGRLRSSLASAVGALAAKNGPGGAAGHLAEGHTCLAWVDTEDDGKGMSRSWVAVGTSSGAVKLYDSATGEVKWQTNSCNEGGVDCLAYSASSSSSTLLSSGRDGQVCSLEPAKGSKRGTFKGSKHAVTAAALSADGSKLILGGSSLSVWDMAAQQRTSKLTGHPLPVQVLAFAPGAGFALSAAEGERLVAVWATPSKQGGRKKAGAGAAASLAVEQPVVGLSTVAAEGEAPGAFFAAATTEAGEAYAGGQAGAAAAAAAGAEEAATAGPQVVYQESDSEAEVEVVDAAGGYDDDEDDEGGFYTDEDGDDDEDDELGDGDSEGDDDDE